MSFGFHLKNEVDELAALEDPGNNQGIARKTE